VDKITTQEYAKIIEKTNQGCTADEAEKIIANIAKSTGMTTEEAGVLFSSKALRMKLRKLKEEPLL
jgi:predicted DsbA family dithiol-disulfide isomerase